MPYSAICQEIFYFDRQILNDLSTARAQKQHIQIPLQNMPKIHIEQKVITHPPDQNLLEQHRRSLASLLRCEIRELLKLISAHLSESSEKGDEEQLDSIVRLVNVWMKRKN